jgi:hypothetical protein
VKRPMEGVRILEVAQYMMASPARRRRRGLTPVWRYRPKDA